jgi:hypothetical protein
MSKKISVRRDPKKGRARLLALGTLIGLVVGRLFDPISGKRRRAELRDRTAALFRRRGRRAGRFGRHVASYTRGKTQRVTRAHEETRELDDATLADKIRTEIFRPADVPKGQINVNVQKGLVQLRGEVPRPELIHDLEEQVRRIEGVREVENLLHPPGVEPQMHH